MIRLSLVVVGLALASSVQAMPTVPLQQPDGMVIMVREGCGPGMVRSVDGVCVARAARRAARRCLRWSGSVCARWE
jgi:hypothetical protein